MKKYLALICILSLVITTVCPIGKVNAYDAGKGIKNVVRINEESYLIIEDLSDTSIVKYYEKDVLKQTTVYNKATGEIGYKEFDSKKGLNEVKREQKYRIEDFISQPTKRNMNNNGQRLITGRSYQDFSLLLSKIVYTNNQPYVRWLYGYTDQKAYNHYNWLFYAGTGISVIVAVVGGVVGYFVSQLASWIISAVGVVGGVIVSFLDISNHAIDYYWKYKFEQNHPTYQEFICTADFVYKTEMEYLVNNSLYWETTYEKPDYEIVFERNHILDYPGLYL